MDKAYWTKEVAEMLGVKPVTIRAWALLYEQRGYRFLRDDKDRRGFTEQDITMFRHYQELINSKSMSQDSAIDAVIARHFNTSIAHSAIESTEAFQQFEKRYNNLDQKVDQLIEMNRALAERLDKQTEYIEDSLKKRDQYLTQVLRGYLESAAQSNKKKWWQFFK